MFGNISIETVGSDELLNQLKVFLSKDNITDIKTHIEILKKAINNTKL